ncbi:MAG: AAA family ATPase [Clostridia bacterium]|nr:AAA family ATPase [Clostridia bacterium]
MQYLNTFDLPTEREEAGFLLSNAPEMTMRCYSGASAYPFGVFPQKGLSHLRLAPLTLLYGTNGSGKSTLLNIMAQKLSLARSAPFNHTPFYKKYLAMCRFDGTAPANSQIITSDAVFDFMLDMRALNEGVDRRREEVFEEYSRMHDPNAHMPFSGLEQYEEFKRFRDAKSSTKSDYTYRRIPRNVQNRSNGESAYAYFTSQITENALYLLDEPENSLSAQMQCELAQFLVEAVRFFGCQLIIATHSPFLLAMRGALIYDLDAAPVMQRRWTELEAVRTYQEFFAAHAHEFEK